MKKENKLAWNIYKNTTKTELFEIALALTNAGEEMEDRLKKIEFLRDKHKLENKLEEYENTNRR